MNFEFEPERKALADAADRLFAVESSPDISRELWDTETGRNCALWKGISEIGLTGVMIPEQFGGEGGSLLDLILVLESIGRHAVPDALLEALVLAPVALSRSNDPEVLALLPAVARGDLRLSLTFRGREQVPDADVSDYAVDVGDDQVVLAPLGGAQMERIASIDPARRVFSVDSETGRDVVLTRSAEDIAALQAHAQAATSAVLIGLSRHILDSAADYARVRTQFGRPIGSFQSIKHQLAESLMRVEISRSAVYTAAHRVASESDNAGDAARKARLCAVEAADLASRVALQVHGGIGFTWENDLQMWLKRSKVLELSYGTGGELATELAESILAG